MLVLKGCKRCAGDLFLERGVGESDLVCLQCGRRWRLRRRETPSLAAMMPQNVA